MSGHKLGSGFIYPQYFNTDRTSDILFTEGQYLIVNTRFADDEPHPWRICLYIRPFTQIVIHPGDLEAYLIEQVLDIGDGVAALMMAFINALP